MAKYDVCVSYARGDGSIPLEVAEHLDGWGHSVYIDKRDEENRTGHDIPSKLQDVFERSSGLCVIFVSQLWNSRPYTQFERRAALAREVREPNYIYPVRLEKDVVVEGLPGGTCYLDGFQMSARSIAEGVDDRLGSRRAGLAPPILHIVGVDRMRLEGSSSEFVAYLGLLKSLSPAAYPRAIVIAVQSADVPIKMLSDMLETLVGQRSDQPVSDVCVALTAPQLTSRDRADFARQIKENARLTESLAVCWDGADVQTWDLDHLDIVLCFFSARLPFNDLQEIQRRLHGRVAIGVTDDASNRIQLACDIELDVLVPMHSGKVSTECVYQEYVCAYPAGPHRQGVYVLCPGNGTPLQIEISESQRAHRERPPSAICAVSRIEREGDRVTIRPPSYRLLVDRPIYQTLRVLQEHLGRSTLGAKQSAYDLRALVNRVWPELLDLQASLDDWQSEARWESIIKRELSGYRRIVCTDRLGPLSWINPRLLEYLGDHFAERQSRRSDEFVRLSQAAYDAAQHTTWISDHRLRVRSADCCELEISRILIWNTAELTRPIERLILRMIDQYHRLFDVPLFVLDSQAIDSSDPVLISEFIVATGPVGRRAYTFNPVDLTSLEATANEASSLVQAFETLLAHPDLRPAKFYLNEGR